jgi:hypothetical protein
MQRVRAEAAALKLAREQQPVTNSQRRALVQQGCGTDCDPGTEPAEGRRHEEGPPRPDVAARAPQVGRAARLPELWRRLFPRPRPFNHIVLEVLAVLTKNDRSLANRIQQLTDCVQAQQQVIRALTKRGDVDAVWMSANAAGDRADDGASQEEFEAVEQHLRDLQGQTDRLRVHVTNLENQTRRLRTTCTLCRARPTAWALTW